jgi:uncharacterized protein with HEPN domain
MSKREITLYIVDIFIAIDKLESYTQPFESAEALLYSDIHWDASIRELEIIGEATKMLLNHQLLDTQYRRIVDFRNQISHGYFGIDATIVWNILKEKLPNYKRDLQKTIEEQNIDLTHAITHAKHEFQHKENILKTLKKLSKLTTNRIK